MPTCVDDGDNRGFGVATGNDGRSLGLGVNVVNHALVELTEAFSLVGGLSPVAQGFAESDWVIPQLEDRISDLFSGI